MCMMEHEHNTKEGQMEHILSENMRMLPDDSDEVDKYGPYLSVSSDDWDELHIREHQAFLDNNKVLAQFKRQMEKHIEKHQIQMKERERMGLKESDTNSEIHKEESEDDYAD